MSALVKPVASTAMAFDLEQNLAVATVGRYATLDTSHV